MLQKIAKILSFFYYLAMEYNLKHYAYIGDCVWELFVRNNIIQKTNVQKTMHKLTTDFVNANSQANFLALIEENLTEVEKEIQKRGRNLKISINKKNNPKIHSLATSFEVLIGYWYLNDKKRLEEVLDFFKKELFK